MKLLNVSDVTCYEIHRLVQVLKYHLYLHLYLTLVL